MSAAGKAKARSARRRALALADTANVESMKNVNRGQA
jgi:hypothetical protein